VKCSESLRNRVSNIIRGYIEVHMYRCIDVQMYRFIDVQMYICTDI